MFLKRWLRRQYIPRLMKTIGAKDVVRVTGELSEMLQQDVNLANFLVKREIESRRKNGQVVNPIEVERERQRLIQKFQTQGERFVKLLERPDLFKYEIAIDVTNEAIDKGVLSQNLLAALQVAPQFQDIIVPQIFDVMGLPIPKVSPQQQQQQQQGPPPAGGPQQNPQRQVTTANTLGG